MCCRETPHDDHGGVEPCPCARCYRITGTPFNKSCSRGWRASSARWASATSCSSRFWNWCGLRLFCPTFAARWGGRRRTARRWRAPSSPRPCSTFAGPLVIAGGRSLFGPVELRDGFRHSLYLHFLDLLEHDVSDLRGAILSLPPYPDCGHTKLFLLEPDGGDDHSTGNVCPYVKWQNKVLAAIPAVGSMIGFPPWRAATGICFHIAPSS